MAAAETLVVSDLLLDKNLGGTGFDGHWVINKLFKHCNAFKKLCENGKVKSMECVGVNNGFTSDVHRLEIEFTSGEKWTAVFKVQVFGRFGSIESADEFAITIHKCECRFFDLIRDVSDLPVPEPYYTFIGEAGKPGAILMEDFSTTCRSMAFFETASLELCIDAAKVLAKFQATMNHMDGLPWKGKFTDNATVTEGIFRLVGAYVPATLVKYDNDYQALLEKTKPVVSKEFYYYANRDLSDAMGVSTLCHGDAHPGNILFPKKDDDTLAERVAVLVDWQAVYEGNPLLDLARFVARSADSDARDVAETVILRAYYDQLVDEYRKRGNILAIPFTFADCQKLFVHAFLAQAAQQAYFIPLLLNAKSKPEERNLHEARIKVLNERVKSWFVRAAQLMKVHNITGAPSAQR